MIKPEVACNKSGGQYGSCQDFVEYAVGRVVKTGAKELSYLGKHVKKLEKVIKPFPRMSYDEVSDILEDGDIIQASGLGIERTVAWPRGLHQAERRHDFLS